MDIKEKRKSKGLTQIELGELMGVNRSTVAMWESGEALPRADKLPFLAEVLGCSIDELFDNNAA